MAHHASALKQMRQSLRHRARNRKNLSQVRTQIKKLREALAKGDADAARTLLPETVGAIDKAAKKGVVHDNAAARYKSRLSRRLAALTGRERQVLEGVVAGLLNKQIAGKLGIAEKTVKTHRGRVMEKMGAGSVAELVRLIGQAEDGA